MLDGQKLESTDINETNGAINLGDGNENVDRIQDVSATNSNEQETKDDSSQTNTSGLNGEQEPESGTNVSINGQQVGASVTNQNEQTNNTSSLLDQKASNDQDSADTPNDTKTTSTVDQKIPGQDEHTLSDTISDIDSDFEESIGFDPNHTMNEKKKTNMTEDSKETNNSKTEDGSQEASLDKNELNGQSNSESKNHSDASSSKSNTKNENDDLYASNGNQNISEANNLDDNENSIGSEKDQNTNETQEDQIPSDHVGGKTNTDSDKSHLPSDNNLVGPDSNGLDNNSDQDEEDEINRLDTNGEQSMTKDHPKNSNVIGTGIETSTVKTNQNTNNDKSNDGSDWFDNWIPDGGSIYESTGNPIKTLENGHNDAGNNKE